MAASLSARCLNTAGPVNHPFASVYQSIDSMIYCTFSVFLKFKEQSSFNKMPVTLFLVYCKRI